jgi:LmbE family N-acetylglucosaminyl deacetylase
LDEARVEFLRLPTAEGGYIVDDEAGFARAAERAASLSPQLVFLPHGHDTNPDHRLAAKWLLQLAADLPEKPEAFFFRDPKTISMRVDAYFPFDRRAAAWKSELLRFHRSQQERNLRTRGGGLDDRILKVNADAASELGIPEAFAEVFEIG